MNTHTMRVEPADIERQRELGWPDFHPEDFCHRCGHQNPVWNVDSDRFNLAMAAIGLDRAAIACPSCFVEGHEKATRLKTVWQMQPMCPFTPIDDRRDALQWENSETFNGWESVNE